MPCDCHLGSPHALGVEEDPRGDAKDLCARWYVYKLGWRRKKNPLVLTTGPEGILCSGRVGIRAPIMGPLPLLGPAAGSQGSLV
jgi:hypothetical protein